jgi:glycerol-3-phosphate dehydrogenase
MAEDTIDEAIRVAHLRKVPCQTESLKIHGHTLHGNNGDHLHIYGTDADAIRKLAQVRPSLSRKLNEAFPHIWAEVVWAVRNEMARTVEDVLARRLRILFLNSRVAVDMAPAVAALMADELGYDDAWQQNQVKYFTTLAERYMPEPIIPNL